MCTFRSLTMMVGMFGLFGTDMVKAQYEWPYHTDRKWYNHYEVDPLYKNGFRAGNEVWYPYRVVGSLQGSPYEGQTAWSDRGRGAYQRLWKVHHIEIETKSVWAYKSSIGTYGISYIKPTKPEGFHEARARIEEGVAIVSLTWVGEKPEWAAEVEKAFVKADSRPALPHWARAERIGWHSGVGYDAFYGDNEDGTVNRYSRQASAPRGGYVAMDNSRWTPYLPNGGARYGNSRSSAASRHRVSHLWKTRGTGRPETKDATVYYTDGSWSIAYGKSSSNGKGYPATITEIKGNVKSIVFHSGEPFPGASRHFVAAWSR